MMEIKWVDITYIEDIKPKQENDNMFEISKCNTGPDINRETIARKDIDYDFMHSLNKVINVIVHWFYNQIDISF